jgi:hypothetical protein
MCLMSGQPIADPAGVLLPESPSVQCAAARAAGPPADASSAFAHAGVQEAVLQRQVLQELLCHLLHRQIRLPRLH